MSTPSKRQQPGRAVTPRPPTPPPAEDDAATSEAAAEEDRGDVSAREDGEITSSADERRPDPVVLTHRLKTFSSAKIEVGAVAAVLCYAQVAGGAGLEDLRLTGQVAEYLELACGVDSCVAIGGHATLLLLRNK